MTRNDGSFRSEPANRQRPFGIWMLGALVGAASLGAATFTVDRIDDTAAAVAMGCLNGTPGDCSLRGAILRANGNLGPDEVVLFDATFALSLAGHDDSAYLGDLDVSDHLVLRAAPGAAPMIEGDLLSAFADRLIDVRGGATLEIEGVRLKPTSAAVVDGCVAAVQETSSLVVREAVVVPAPILGTFAQCAAFAVFDGSSLGLEDVALASFYRGVQTLGASTSITVRDSTLVACEDGALVLFGGTGLVEDSHFVLNGDPSYTGAAGPRFGAMAVGEASLTVRRTTLRANTTWDRPGAAILLGAADLVLEDSVLEDNEARGPMGVDMPRGGALSLADHSSAQVRRTRFSENSARYGGAVAVAEPAAPTFFESSEFRGNLAFDGGAIWAFGDGSVPLVVDRTTLWGNHANAATGSGGAVYVGGAIGPQALVLRNSTLTSNRARFGGAMTSEPGTQVTTEFTTFSANVSSTSPFLIGGTGTAIGTVFGGGCAGAGVGSLTSLGANVESPGATCGLGSGPGDQSGVADLMLGTLGRLPDRPPTLLPRPGSPLRDVRSCSLVEDQRAVPRPQDGGGGAFCDAGAAEARPNEDSEGFADGFESGDASAWSAGRRFTRLRVP